MGIESLGNMPICFRCRFWQMEPGALEQRQSFVLDSIPDLAGLDLTEAARSLLSQYGKCKAVYLRKLLTLKGLKNRYLKGSLYDHGTTALSICESKDNQGNILFNETEIG